MSTVLATIEVVDVSSIDVLVASVVVVTVTIMFGIKPYDYASDSYISNQNVSERYILNSTRTIPFF